MGLILFSEVVQQGLAGEREMSISKTNAAGLLAVAAALILTWFVYQPGLSGDFIFDDYPNILNNDAIAIDSLNADSLKQATASGTAGPLNRPVSMLSFALNHYLTGFDSRSFKSVNLVIHGINGIAAFMLAHLLLSAYQLTRPAPLSRRHVLFISAAVSAAWLVHPINLTSVLYVVQRMNALAALFSFAGLILYSLGRMRQLNGTSGWLWILSSLFVATPLAVLSKENGLLLPLLLTVIEITIFRFRTADQSSKRALIALHIAIVILPSLAVAGIFIWHPEILLGAYQNRDFTLAERLLTQTKVIWFYIQQIVMPANNQLGMYHDDIAISRSLFEPPTAAATASLAILTATGLYSIFRMPILAFGILFYLAGHSLESTIIPLEIAHEHRNYLPSFGLLFALIFYMAHPLKHLSSLRLRQAGTLLLVVSFALVTSLRANLWSDPLTHTTAESDNHPNSPRANLAIGQVYMDLGLIDEGNREIFLTAANYHFQRSSQLRESFVDGLFAQLFMKSKLGSTLPQDIQDELLGRLEGQPFSSTTVSWINYLTKCIARNECAIPDTQMHAIIQAALANKNVRGRTKAELYTAASNYYFYLRDYESVLYLAAEAANTQPSNPRYRVNLTNVLVLLGRLDDAKAELEQAATDDRFSVYNTEIDRLSSIIADLRSQGVN